MNTYSILSIIPQENCILCLHIFLLSRFSYCDNYYSGHPGTLTSVFFSFPFFFLFFSGFQIFAHYSLGDHRSPAILNRKCAVKVRRVVRSNT